MAMFPCQKCGECCRHIGNVSFVKDMALSNGICKFLDERTNLCSRYETRPIFCNIDLFYDKFMKRHLSKREFYQKNMEICQSLRLSSEQRGTEDEE